MNCFCASRSQCASIDIRAATSSRPRSSAGTTGHAPKLVAHAALPLMLAAATTAIGLLSLCYSELTPIQLFGIFSAIGVVVGSVTQFLLLPAALAVLTPRPRAKRADAHDAGPDAESQLAIFPRLGVWVTSHPTLVTAVCLAIMLTTAAGLPPVRHPRDLELTTEKSCARVNMILAERLEGNLADVSTFLSLLTSSPTFRKSEHDCE